MGIEFDNGLTIAFQVKDMKKTAAWYERVLGYKTLFAVDEIGWCEVATNIPGVSFGFSQVESPKAGGPVPTIGVKNLDMVRAAMEKQDVRFDGPTREYPGMVRLATFFDPDGNAVMLSQTLMQH